jgi:hypothetical protein
VTAYTVGNARGRTVLPASDAATAALYRRIFDDKHGQGSHRVVAAGPEVRAATRLPPFLAALLALPLLVTTGALPAWAGTTDRVSVGPNGVQANNTSVDPSISADGRYVAFASNATNLVPGITSEPAQIYVHDRFAGTTELASASSNGIPADDTCYSASISATGRYVAFETRADNLVPVDTNSEEDVFVRDLQTRKTVRISVSSRGAQAKGLSRYPVISADGRHVAFSSTGSHLTKADTNEQPHVFVRDLDSAATEIMDVSPKGIQGNMVGSSRVGC